MAPAGGAARSGESLVDRADEKTISEDDNHQSAKAQYERVADGHGPFRLTTVMEDGGSDREGPPRLRPWLSSELRSNSNSVGIGCSTVKASATTVGNHRSPHAGNSQLTRSTFMGDYNWLADQRCPYPIQVKQKNDRCNLSNQASLCGVYERQFQIRPPREHACPRGTGSSARGHDGRP